ncbi:uncharacterized protein [Manis javanica]|uniref:uncharacterized protein isoform X2 n=1 Tax=Manis javanica TaxID=9974 RepID=UPI003C6D9E3C
MLMDLRSSGSSPCSAVPSSRCLSAGGTDIGPQPQIASSRPVGPRRSSRPFSALPRRAEGGSQHGLSASGGGDGPGLSGQVVEIAARASRALPPPAGAVGRRDREPRRRRGPAFSLGGRSGQPRNAWGNLSHADRITNAVESSTGKRLPLPQIGGGSRAGPTSGMRSTATALRAGMEDGVPFSWWVGWSGERHPSWTGAPAGAQQCGCGLDQSCLDVGHLCSCGSDKDGCILNKLQEATSPYKRTNDTGLLSFRDHLPVTQIVIMGTNRSNSEAAWRIGPLRCYGDQSSSLEIYLHAQCLAAPHCATVNRAE